MEKKLVAWLKQTFNSARGESYAKIGIGDDCAVLPPNSNDLVVTCDAILDGVHFLSTQHDFKAIGRKALAVNLSDLASMAATPRAAIVSLNLPRSMTFDQVTELYLGMSPLADETNIQICGGDTNVWDGPLSISITAIGTAPEAGAWTINGAKPKDRILVTGVLGGSIIARHMSFRPRNHLVELIPDKSIVHACTDISDSLGIDLAKIAVASKVGFELDARQIPIGYGALKMEEHSDLTAVKHALTDGEDFELLFAVSPGRATELMRQVQDSETITDIGCFIEGNEFWLVDENGKERFVPSGYEHGSTRLDIEK